MALILAADKYRFQSYLLIGCLLILLTVSCRNTDKKTTSETIITPATTVPAPDAVALNKLVAAIRDGSIDTSIAQNNFRDSLLHVKAYYKSQPGQSSWPVDSWVFPLQGYSVAQSIAEKDEGYIPGRYSFFQGNAHKGHPAVDIFIYDKDQDVLDDRTGKEVQILSVSAGMVIATQTQWDTTSTLRGGKYIWIYDPQNDYLLYYAHNNRLLVKPGQWLKPGDPIATCGRTGANAYKERSPTHLHFTLLKLDSNMYPRPVNPFPFLNR